MSSASPAVITDITEWLQREASSVKPGHLVKEQGANLLDIMNALEMMNPQMDTYVVKPAIAPFDPTATLDSAQVCSVMDEMLAMEHLWWSGENLCQTVFTMLPFHNFDLISNPTLRAYAFAYAKSVEMAYNELCKGHIADGEDCWLDYYGIALRIPETVNEIKFMLGAAIEEADAPTRHRLQMRWAILSALEGQPSGFVPPPWSEIGEGAPIPAGLAGRDVSSYLRQCIPLPPAPKVDSAASWEGMRAFLEDMRSSSQVWNEEEWRLALRGRTMPPLTRSVYKTLLLERSNVFLEEWTHRHLGKTIDPSWHDQIPRDKASLFALWRDLFRGTMLSTLFVPLLNRSRQRREYMALAYTWYERASTARHLSASVPALEGFVPLALAARYDCMLEAALSAFDLGLNAPNEEHVSWWWINAVSRARAALPTFRSWESVWAEAWAEISSAMLATCRSGTISRAQFDMRYKWAMKAPNMYPSEKQLEVLGPKYEDWASTAQMQRKHVPVDHIQRAIKHLRFLDSCLENRPYAHAFEDVLRHLMIQLGAHVKPPMLAA